MNRLKGLLVLGLVAFVLVFGFAGPAWAVFTAPTLDTADYMAVAAAVLGFVAVVYGIKKAIRLLG